MSVLQERAVGMIYNLSDDNIEFLIEIIQRLMPSEAVPSSKTEQKDGRAAFERLLVVNEEIRNYLPNDFDPERELEEARIERYGKRILI